MATRDVRRHVLAVDVRAHAVARRLARRRRARRRVAPPPRNAKVGARRRVVVDGGAVRQKAGSAGGAVGVEGHARGRAVAPVGVDGHPGLARGSLEPKAPLQVRQLFERELRPLLVQHRRLQRLLRARLHFRQEPRQVRVPAQPPQPLLSPHEVRRIKQLVPRSATRPEHRQVTKLQDRRHALQPILQKARPVGRHLQRHVVHGHRSCCW
mmetsp:Transcript_19661/g.60812  ORF Transcript_19661/g.60812 Transcript_19661/m.60812 type:complete len:210 (-) Transcript_19661:44-673(-)